MPSLRDGDARARPPRPLVGAPCGPLLVAEGALCFWRLLSAGATLVALPRRAAEGPHGGEHFALEGAHG